jgi:methylated-DNA-protein-cysteine methyltransferase-like protein
VAKIPPGRVTSYGSIANALGASNSSRLVGYAMNECHKFHPNLPAHRVVNRNGLLTGKHHFPTETAMQELLEAEGIKIVSDQILKFKELFWDPSIELL